jgi:hypothetical protein
MLGLLCFLMMDIYECLQMIDCAFVSLVCVCRLCDFSSGANFVQKLIFQFRVVKMSFPVRQRERATVKNLLKRK